VVAASVALAACGGAAPDPAAPAHPGPSTADSMTSEQAVRFLLQASFSAGDADIERAKTLGYGGWIDEQAGLAGALSHVDWMVAKGFSSVAHMNGFTGVDNSLWRKFISSPDTLRQRMTFTLSSIFVVSMASLPVHWRGFALAAYVDMLSANCLANYRVLLEKVTLSCAMGSYLSMRGSQKEDPARGRQPDENYAREVLQLFSLGLYMLNPDGTRRLDETGRSIESYDQATIVGLAKVFTGWNFDAASGTGPSFMSKPMVFDATRFSTSAKSFLGVTIPGTTDGVTALGIALDTIFNHPNVGPFIGRQLIQRLVTSNPSTAYVGRVAAAFNDNGSGVRGDMLAVVKAVLLDAEARTGSAATDWGKVREPVLRFIQWARTFGARSPTDSWNIGDLSDPATRLGQSPMRSPTVFNFFRPGYVPPNTALGALGLVAPELQIADESSLVGYANFMQAAIAAGRGEVLPDYSAELAQAGDAQALVERYALRLAAGALSAQAKDLIATAVGSISAANDTGRLNRVRAAIHLIMCSPEYLVQK
ncbi:MAG: DUF1800 domain-containing protein, partial [Burkholderiaceae bacterium]